jgi:hypothetical protein
MESHAATVNYAAAAPHPAVRGGRRLGTLAAVSVDALSAVAVGALSAVTVGAVLVAGFLAYRDPSLALSLENLRLCF